MALGRRASSRPAGECAGGHLERSVFALAGSALRHQALKNVSKAARLEVRHHCLLYTSDAADGDESIQLANETRERGVEVDFLVGLSKSGVPETLVGIILAPARKRDLKGMGPQFRRPLGEDHPPVSYTHLTLPTKA